MWYLQIILNKEGVNLGTASGDRQGGGGPKPAHKNYVITSPVFEKIKKADYGYTFR